MSTSSNSAIFLSLGKVAVEFGLSLIQLTPDQIDSRILGVANAIASLIIWVFLLRVAIAIIKKATGFEPRPRQ